MGNKSKRQFNLKQSVAIIAVVVSFLFIGSVAMANNTNITELQEQRQEIVDNIAEQRRALDQARNDRNDTMAEIIALDIELSEVTAAYYEAADNLAEVTRLLEQAQTDLAAAEEQRELQFEILRSRLRSIHENSPMGYIELLFSSGSVADFLNNMEHFSRIIEHDHNMLDELIETEERIARNMHYIAVHHEEVLELTLELEARIADLETTLLARGARIEELEAEEESYLAMIDSLESNRQDINLSIAAAQAQADAARAQQSRAQSGGRSTVNVSVDAPFVWPVDGPRGVNSPYGSRTHPISRRTEFHTGVDLRGSHGTRILAADEGFVSFAGWMNGYGNTVILDHGLNSAGQRITTLYAHNSRNIVSQGQWVDRGQHIANVGSTGISTGPHLHFEVLVNGNHTNPNPFLGIR